MNEHTYKDAQRIIHRFVTNPTDGRFGYTVCGVLVADVTASARATRAMITNHPNLDDVIREVMVFATNETPVTCFYCAQTIGP